MQTSRPPTDAELQILRALWKVKRGTVRQVQDELGSDVAYTTVLTLLQIMIEKGLVKRDESARAHVYEAVHTRERTQQGMLRNLMKKAFGGSCAGLVLRALSDEKLSREEMKEIRDFLQQLEKERK